MLTNNMCWKPTGTARQARGRTVTGWKAMTEQTLVPVEAIAATILTLRGQRIILDSDLARLYGVTTARLNQQTRRNWERFPDDFMFQLTAAEYENLMLQNAISRGGHGGRRTLPLAFTEHGALMAANVLNSGRAMQVSVYVIRAFVAQRALLASNTEILLQLEKIENKLLAARQVAQLHDDQLTALETQVETIIDTLNAMTNPDMPPRRTIGFLAGEDEE